MSLYQIPLDPSGTLTQYDLTVDLGEISYVLTFRWSRLGQCWTLDVTTEDLDPIAQGVLLTPYIDLLQGATHVNRPPGILTLVHANGGTDLPTIQTLGNAYNLYYSDPI